MANTLMQTDHHPAKAEVQHLKSVIDGHFIVNELYDSFRIGHVRPNTPIAWNYAEHEVDAWYYEGFMTVINKVPALVAQLNEITALIENQGYEIPSDYTDQYFEQLYGTEHLSEFLAVFGCSRANGKVIECGTALGHWMTSSAIVCNTRKALRDMYQVSGGSYGPVYPMEFRIRDDEGRSPHCGHQEYTYGEGDMAEYTTNAAMAQEMRDNYGLFFRTGTFPQGYLKNFVELGDNTNVIRTSGLVYEETFKAECQVLDKIDNYIMDRWAFGEGKV